MFLSSMMFFIRIWESFLLSKWTYLSVKTSVKSPSSVFSMQVFWIAKLLASMMLFNIFANVSLFSVFGLGWLLSVEGEEVLFSVVCVVSVVIGASVFLLLVLLLSSPQDVIKVERMGKSKIDLIIFLFYIEKIRSSKTL